MRRNIKFNECAFVPSSNMCNSTSSMMTIALKKIFVSRFLVLRILFHVLTLVDEWSCLSTKLLFWHGPRVFESCSKMSHTSSCINESSCSLAWSWAWQAITSSKVAQGIGSHTCTKCKKAISGLKWSTFPGFSFEISSYAPIPKAQEMWVSLCHLHWDAISSSIRSRDWYTNNSFE
jgi:hypothetical protein